MTYSSLISPVHHKRVIYIYNPYINNLYINIYINKTKQKTQKAKEEANGYIKKNPISRILLREIILSVNLDIRLITVIQFILRQNAICRYHQLTSAYKNNNSFN